MKAGKYIILLFAGMLFGCSVSVKIEPSPQGADFYPLEAGTTWKYFTFNGNLEREVLNKTLMREGVEYKIKVHRYETGETDTTFHRKEDGTVYMLDNKTFVENVQIPKILEEGYAWMSIDHDWSYEVKTIDTVFNSPEKEWKNVLVIQAMSTEEDDNNGEKYNLFFAKDVGHVGSTTSTGFSSFLMEWE